MFDTNKYLYSFESVGNIKETELTVIDWVSIIALSNKCNLDEKMNDLQELIEHCTDTAVCKDIELLIQLWKKILADRHNNMGVIFLAKLQEQDKKNDKLSAYRFFSSYDTALKFLQKEKDCLRETDTYGEIWRMELDTADPNCDIYYFGNDMELANIVCCSNRAEAEDMKLFRYMQYVPDADLDYSIKAELEKMMNR